MRKSIILIMLLIVLAGDTTWLKAQTHATSPPQAEAKTCIGRANKAKIQAYVMLLRLRWDLYAKWKESGVWPADAETDKALDAHAAYWAKQLKDGRAILAGGMNGDYWDNVALIIFEAASMEEAEKLAKNDPAVKAYAFQAQVRSFDVHWLTNKFQPGVEACAEAKAPPAK
jgi:uncharacterized protein YciI